MLHWRRLLGLAAVGVAAVAILSFPSRTGEAGKADNQVIIIASASVRGEISPCG